MSQVYPAPVHQTVVVHQTPSNGLGTAGFVISLIGFLTCGLLCPLGLLLSFFGLLKAPRGLAIAGTILGGLGSFVFLIWGFAIIAGLIGLGSAADEAAKELKRQNDAIERRVRESGIADNGQLGDQSSQLLEAEEVHESQETANDSSITTAPGSSSLQSPGIPEPPIEQSPSSSVPELTQKNDKDKEFRTWGDNTGKFSVEAKFVKHAMGKVTLQKRDGKIIEMPIERLSTEDQQFVRRQGM